MLPFQHRFNLSVRLSQNQVIFQNFLSFKLVPFSFAKFWLPALIIVKILLLEGRNELSFEQNFRLHYIFKNGSGSKDYLKISEFKLVVFVGLLQFKLDQ